MLSASCTFGIFWSFNLMMQTNSQVSVPAQPRGPAQNLSCKAAGGSEEDISAPGDLSGNGPSPNSPGESSQGEAQAISAPLRSPSQRLLVQILTNNAAQQQKRFASTVFECGVCFLSRPGSECVRLAECGHVFCRACLSQFCKVQIIEGNVQGVACPQGDCSSAPTPAQVPSGVWSVAILKILRESAHFDSC